MADICEGCTARYASGLAACPQCGSVKRHDEHDEPAKVSTVPVPKPDEKPEPVKAEPVTPDEPGEPKEM